MYNAIVVQYSNDKPIRMFPATVKDGLITASAFLCNTGLEGTVMYEDYLTSHFLSQNATFAIVDEEEAKAVQEVLCADSSFL